VAYCPQCGAQAPADPDPLLAKRSFRISTPLKFIVLGIVLWIATKSGVNIGGGSQQPPVPASPCKTDWTRCTDNADLMNEYDGTRDAQFACKLEAGQRAKYGDPKFGWLDYFDRFHKGDDYPKTGIAILIENDAQFQNAFGAMVHSIRSKRVIDVVMSAH
jgi:hypothetical protein